jgi:hypothetical protein
MKENYHLQIKEPCNVGRENMTTVPGGSFCDLCSKKVHDLTNKTDEEIHLLLQSNDSVCGRIQASRLYFPEEETKAKYNFFNFPFRKVAGGIFLAAMLTSGLNAQKKDTLREVQEIEGMVLYAPRTNDSDTDYYVPKTIQLNVEYSGNKALLGEHNRVSILTLDKQYNTYYGDRFLSVPEDYLGFRNILVFENAINDESKINENQYYTFLNKKHIKNNEIIPLDLDKVKKIEFNPKNKEPLYFLNGEEMSKEDYEDKTKNKKVDSYFLSEMYAKELLDDNYDYENGIILSYTKD